jgi:hypothetical protein
MNEDFVRRVKDVADEISEERHFGDHSSALPASPTPKTLTFTPKELLEFIMKAVRETVTINHKLDMYGEFNDTTEVDTNKLKQMIFTKLINMPEVEEFFK